MFEMPPDWSEKYKDDAYFKVYEFIPPLTVSNFLSRFGLAWPKAIDVLANLDKGFNVLELALALRVIHKDITPEEVLGILRQMEARGFVRVKGEKKEIELKPPPVTKVVKCPECGAATALEIDLTDLDFSKGYATITYIHGKPKHVLVIYVDKEGGIRSVNVVKDVVSLE